MRPTTRVQVGPTRRPFGVALKVILGATGAVIGVLALGFVLAGLLGERADIPPVGVAKVNGDLVVYMCRGRQVGSVEIQRGDDVDGPLVLTAHTTEGGKALRALPVRAQVPGYSIRMLEPLNEQLAVRAMTNNRGVSALRSSLVFRPAELDDGSIVTESGKTLRLAAWLANSDC